MAERRKKTKAGTKGKEATAKKPRSRKVRAKPPVSEAASAPAESRPEGQTSGDTLKSQNPAPGGPRAPLPGELYRRQDQWWWRVQLPGEDKATARPLKADGEKTATDGQEAAEKIAFEMWERAVEENATRRIRLESTEKIERLKAQFLDRVRHFTELVETANAKVETEQRARTAAEAKLAQRVQAVGPMTPNAGQAGPDEEQPVVQDMAQAPVGARMEQAKQPVPSPIPDQRAVVVPVSVVVQVPSSCEHIQVPSGQIGQTEPVVTSAVEPLPASVETGLCECCGATGIARTHLRRIDSGQLLCPRCLAALRTDATRSA